MSRNGSGAYSRVPGSAYTNGTTADGSELDAEFNDIATEITGSIAKNGETTPTANLPMGTYRHTGVGAASARTDYARAGEAQDSTYQWLTSVSGADTITATGAISVAAYATGQTFRFATAGANTGAATLNINAIGAKAVTKNGTTALVSGDLVSGAVYEVTYDGTRFQLQSSPVIVTTVTGTLPIANGGTGQVTATAAFNALSPTTTQGDIIYHNGTDDVRLAADTPGYYLKTQGAGANPVWAAVTIAGITLGTAQATTSGTSITFSSIPAGTKRITVNFSGVSTNGTSNLLIQLGDSGGIEATGYISAGQTNGTTISTDTTGLIVSGSHAASGALHGSVILNLENSTAFTWTAIGATARSDGNLNANSGSKSLTAELTQIKIVAVNGTDAFDAGEINISYE